VNRRDRGWGTPFRKLIVKLEMANSLLTSAVEIAVRNATSFVAAPAVTLSS
jgi:hypothetical protein